MEHHQKLGRGLRRVFAALSETLTESELEEVRRFVDHGEYGLALETLCDIVEEEDKRVSPEAYDRVCKPGASMGTEQEMERRLRGFVLGRGKPLEQ